MTPIDALLLLAAQSFFRGQGTQTFVQKALFCAEEDLGGSAPFPSFPFYRWKHGPYSKELANTAARLSQAGWMAAKDGPITPRARRLLAELRPALNAYPEIEKAFGVVESYARRFATMELPAVLAEVYARKVVTSHGVEKIGDVAEGADLIEPHAPSLDRYEQLVELVAWRLSQTEDEAREEADSPLVSDERAKAFRARHLA